MPKRWCTLFLGLLLLGMNVSGTAVGQGQYGKFDRMTAIEKFLDAIYPELRNRTGQLTFEVEEFNASIDTPIYVDFAECHVGSGVPAGGYHPSFHRCPVPGGAPPITNYLLRSRVDTRTSGQFRISVFWAYGELITAKLDRLKEQIKQNPTWTEEEMVEALKQSHPKFGPDQREAFLKQVPLQLIRDFSGCKLDLTRARFRAFRLGSPPDEPVIYIYWEIEGTYKRHRDSATCSAHFEPFDGKLTALTAR
jgi:hypothetical protein